MSRKSAHILDLEAREESRTGSSKKKFHSHDLAHIKPLTETQRDLFTAYFSDFKALALHGAAGSGKTFLAMYLALSDVLNPSTPYDKLIIVRSAVQTRSLGFTTGSREEKEAEYETPYRQICDELFSTSKSYENLKKGGYIEFISTSFARGLTIKNAIVVFDEAANCNFQELDMVFTRLGENSKMLLCGDVKQADLRNRNDLSGLADFMKIMHRLRGVASFEFTSEDCVRSGIVKDYLQIKEEMNF